MPKWKEYKLHNKQIEMIKAGYYDLLKEALEALYK